MKSHDSSTLESLVDTYGLRAVILALEEICGEKADHLQSNWQDTVTAKAWRTAAKQMSTTADTRAVLGVAT